MIPSSIQRFAISQLRILSPATLFGASLLLLAAAPGVAQTTAPILMPNTFSTVAGGAGGATSTGLSAGVACVTGSPYKAADIYGNGCPATQAVLGFDLHGGVVVDGQNNIWINDANNVWSGSSVSMLRKVNAASGIITSVLNSGSSICTAATGSAAGSMSSNGDGCLFAAAKHAKERGISIDPYGNVLISGYGSNEVRVVCNAVSPLCPIAAGVSQTYSSAQKQVGRVYRLAGCVATGASPTNASGATAAGSAGDGYFASSFWNLPGDVTAWGASNSSFSATPTITGTNGTCVATTGELNGPRGVAADQYGNVFIGDGSDVRYRVIVGPPTYTLPNGTLLTNPLPAILALNPLYASVTAAQMYGRIYPMIGGYTATTAGSACPASSSYTALDTYGDSCPWYNTSVGSSLGITIDTTGDLVISDTTDAVVRVLYLGPTVSAVNAKASPATYQMANAIALNNTTLSTITQGNVYLLAGKGATGIGATPTLGTSTNIGQTYARLAAAPNGNLYFGGYNTTSGNIAFFDLSTGYVRELLQSSGAASASVTIQGGSSAITVYYCPTPGAGDGTAGYTGTGLSTTACFVGNGSGSGTLGVAADSNNNLYIADSDLDGTTTSYSRSRIRKVLASQLYSTTMGAAALTQTLRIHGATGTTAGATAIGAATYNTPGDIAVATPACAGTAAADGTVDCLATATFTPSAPGVRTANLALTPAAGTGVVPANYPLFGLSTGSALVADPTALATATTVNLMGTGTTPVGVALDAAGDVFTMDTAAGKFVEITGGTPTQLSGSLPSSPTQIALDLAGNVYAAGAGPSTLTKLTLGTGGTYSSGSISITGVARPQAVTFDAQGNMYVADLATTSVYEVGAATLSGSTLPSTGSFMSLQPLSVVASGLNSPTSLAVDGLGNLYIGDTGAGAIVRVDGKTSAQTTLLSSVHPAAIAADAAGNVYYQDSTTLSITEIPVSGPASVTVLGSLSTPSGLAVAGNGNVYSADAGTGTLLQISRNALTYNFGTTTGTNVAATITNVGNLASTGSAEIDATEFPISSGTPNGCGAVPSTSNGLAVGAACNLTATFVPSSGSVPVTGTATLLPAASTTGSLILKGTENSGSNPTTTAAISGSTNTAAYATSGTELTYTVTITASDSSTPAGYVNVSIDSGTAVQYSLVSGAVSIPISGLAAGSHSISAIYPGGQGSDLQSNTATQSFNITAVTVTVAWTPTTTAVQYGAPVSSGALNATATYNSVAVPGVFVYQANGAEINAATYLAIGSYTLTATFYPTDTVDYTAGSTGSGGTFTVSQATTTAPVGVTTNLVAADGSGNYTSIQTALASLSATTGGSIYIKPGTYTGFVTVVSPFVSMYGLGGNPQNVILTNEDGAFSSPYLSGQGPGNNNSQGDQGSSTMVVARGSIAGYNGGATTTPYGFYAEGFSILNTYDTDSTNSTTNALVGNTCTAGQTARSNATLFNAGLLCNSQALAIWVTADQAVLNNIYTASLQDTIYAGSVSASGGNAARQLWFRGKVTGAVDYIFGDAAAVFDHTSIYSVYHGSVTGGVTIEAQNKAYQSGGAGDYLSGYIMNSDVFTSYGPGMTGFYFGRPYGTYSTYVMLNSHIDQVVATGYEEFSGDNNLPTSTYVEYNDIAYTDPATNANDLNGIPYLGSGGNTGQGVIVNGTTVKREVVSSNPGTIEAATGGVQNSNSALPNTTLSAAQAQQYYPINFLGATVAATAYNNNVTKWNPTTAIANGANAFVPAGTASTVTPGTSVTILMRPQTPGLGAVANGTYTIPTGTYTLTDSYNGGSSYTLASGSLDASGSAYFTTSTLSAGTHSLTWTYGGDSNFAGSASGSAYTLTISGGTGVTTTTALSAAANPIQYGAAAGITATVTAASGTATGSVTLTIDGSSTQTMSLSSGAATFPVTGLTVGTHSFSASFAGNAGYAASSTTGSLSLVVNKAALTVTAGCSNRIFDQANTCSAPVTGAYQYSDTSATVFSAGPTAVTTATRVSPAGNYSVTASYALTTFGNANYAVTPAGGSFTIAGNAPQAITFLPLPNFPSGGSYQLTARSSSGLPITYTVTAGSASVTGSTLTVSGTGLVTVQASQATDPNNNYAAATPVSRSFTAQ